MALLKSAHEYVRNTPTVSPLWIPLVYCHINGFQRASSVEKPWPGGEKRIGGRASHHEASEAIGSLLLPYAATGVSLLVMGGRSGAPPRGQPWTSAVTLSQGRNGLSVRRMAGVVDVSRALAVSPLALRITAQRVARFDPYNTRNCLLLKKLRREIQ